MQVHLVTGSYPPDVCGVADYSKRLAEELISSEIKLKIYRQKDLKCKFSFLRALRNPENIFHIQYPAQGYGKKISAQVVSILAKNSVVTIHEFSQVRLLRKLAIIPLIIFSKRIVLTNSYEMVSILRLFPRSRKKMQIIPIGSNIAIAANASATRNGVLYFGLIRPNKGLEEYIKCVEELLKAGYTGPFRILGAVLESRSLYAQKILGSIRHLPIEINLNQPSETVSEQLQRTKYAYLYYPDGLSERRGTYFASLGHGLIVLSNPGTMTPAEFEGTYIKTMQPADAAQKIISTEKNHTKPLDDSLDLNAIKNVQIKYSWRNIGHRHMSLYSSFFRRY